MKTLTLTFTNIPEAFQKGLQGFADEFKVEVPDHMTVDFNDIPQRKHITAIDRLQNAVALALGNLLPKEKLEEIRKPRTEGCGPGCTCVDQCNNGNIPDEVIDAVTEFAAHLRNMQKFSKSEQHQKPAQN